ncbi:MAG TPA: GGDEF domain-containing protein [Patescibacteria group bacterium]
MCKDEEMIAMLRERNEKLARENEELTLRIQSLEKELKECRKLAMIDPITGIYNLNYVNSEIERIRAFKKRERASSSTMEFVTVLFIDVDKLKSVNDRYGHAAGNAVLCKIGQVLNNSIRRSDIAAHLHGDEFVVLSMTTKRSQGRLLYKRIKEELRSVDVIVNGEVTITVSASVGYRCIVLKKDFSFEALKDAADLQMYLTKKAGG